ncbi:MAG: hypothetical protein ACREK2_04845 [Gemmatimonadota bacterium]
MSPARIPDDDSLRAPLFSTMLGLHKIPASPRQEPPDPAPADGHETELRPHLFTKVCHPFEEDGR